MTSSDLATPLQTSDRTSGRPSIGVDTPSALLVAGVGAGKTIMALSAIVELGASCTLVVGTRMVVESVWHTEAANWTHTQHLDVQRVVGNPAARMAALERGADVLVISYDNLAWLADNWDMTRFDLVVWDEVSKLKSISSGRFRRLRRWIPKLKRRIGLTATPASNVLEDVFGIAYACDGGARFGRAFTVWREEYFKADYLGYNWTPRVGALEAITLAMRDMCRVMGDYASLPGLEVVDVAVVLGSRAYKLDAAIDRDGLVVVDGVEILAETAAVRVGKRQQLASGFLYGEKGVVVDIHREKMKVLNPLIERADGPVIIGYTYTEDLARLQAAYPSAVQLDGSVIDAWNRSEIPILLVHPLSGGHGLNLQLGDGHSLILYGLNWSLELFQQLIGRLRRSGQSAPVVRVWRLVATGTADEGLLEGLAAKDGRQLRVVSGLGAG